MSMSSTSTGSSLSSQNFPSLDPFVVVRADSPILGFDNDPSDDPLRFPSPDYSRSLPYGPFFKPEGPLPLPPSVVPGLQKRASAMSLRRRASTFFRSRASSSASRSLLSPTPASTDSVRRAVYVDANPGDSDSDFAHRLSALLSAPATAPSSRRLNFPTYTPSDSSLPSSRNSPRLPFSFPLEDLSLETSPEFACNPYLEPPSPGETSRWSLSSAIHVPTPPSPPLHPIPASVDRSVLKSPNRKSIMHFATKKFIPEPQSPTAALPKERKRNRLASLIPRLGLAPRSSAPALILSSITASSSSSTPLISRPHFAPPTPLAVPGPSLVNQVPTVPGNHAHPASKRPVLRPSKSEYLLRRDPPVLHGNDAPPPHSIQIDLGLADQTHTRRHSDHDDQAKYPSPLTLPHTQYLPSSNRRSILFRKDSSSSFAEDCSPTDDEDFPPPPPPKDVQEQGAALLGLVFGPERFARAHRVGLAF